MKHNQEEIQQIALENDILMLDVETRLRLRKPYHPKLTYHPVRQSI